MWGLLAAAALLWPDHLSGPFDGVPLDRTAEAVLVGVIFPALWVFHSRFLATRLARASIVALLVWRACATVLFVQDGWCLRFEPSRPYAKDAEGAPHAWDLRADWRAADPACSAIMTRSYSEFHEFPVWFFNLPPPNDSWPAPEDLPPEATIAMHVRGYLSPSSSGSFDIDVGPGMQTAIAIDGRLSALPVQLAPGVHHVAIDGTLTGTRWRLVPRWNGAELWSNVSATVQRPSIASLRVRSWARWVPLGVTALLLSAWIASALARVGHVAVFAWTTGASLIIAWLIVTDQVMSARWAIVALTAAVFVPVPPRLRNLFGAFLLIGVPWLTFVVVCAAPAIGRWVLYEFGNDYWMYQRYAYRIVMQGYWLEGGTPTFYFQPFYRWIAGLLHLVFGDSSVGEWYWDGACLLAGSLLSFRITRTFAGFRWGVVAAAAPLGVFVLSSARDLIGRGLGEIASAGLVSMAALCAISSGARQLKVVGSRQPLNRGLPAVPTERPLYVSNRWSTSRDRRTGAAIAAGVLGTLAFYTRLNNLLMALGVAVFALPLRVPVRALVRPLEWKSWWSRVSWRTAIAVPAVIGLGLLCFAWRTWHYTGVFSVFHGTQRYIVAIWQPGMSLGAVAYWMGHNVLLVLTVNDPPRFDVYASPVLIGAAVAVLAVLGVPRFRDLPAAAVLFFFAAIAGAFIARGWTYPGRFSVHVMPIACALAVCGVASLFRRGATVSKPHSKGRTRVSARGRHMGRPLQNGFEAR